MKKTSWFVLCITAIALILISCGDGVGVSGPYLGTGTIRIVSVTPASGLTSGTNQDFTVQVGYTLAGASTAVLSIGFGEINSGYSITTTKVEENVPATNSEVIKTYNITNVYVSSYADPASQFGMRVSTIPYPKPASGVSYSPVASDTHIF